MGIYIEYAEKPKTCWGCAFHLRTRNINEQSGDITFCIVRAGMQPQITGVGDTPPFPPTWCPIEEFTEDMYRAARCASGEHFVCNRKAPCNTDPICGKECTETFDKRYAVIGEE